MIRSYFMAQFTCKSWCESFMPELHGMDDQMNNSFVNGTPTEIANFGVKICRGQTLSIRGDSCSLTTFSVTTFDRSSTDSLITIGFGRHGHCGSKADFIAELCTCSSSYS